MRILYFGSSELSSQLLEFIAESGEDIVGVVTQPPRPGGRGYKLVPTPVYKVAKDMGLSVFTPERLNTKEMVKNLNNLKPDIILLFAYGVIVGKRILSIPKLGAVNFHPSLLPLYRGAAPINRAIMAGERRTGVTLFFMNEELDAGDILLQREFPVSVMDDECVVQEKVLEVGKEMMAELLDRLPRGELTPTPQDHTKATFAPKIEKEELIIDWNKSAMEIHNLVRAVNCSYVAHTSFRGQNLKVYRTTPLDGKSGKRPGEIVSLRGGLVVSAGKGLVLLREIQPPGRRRMDSMSFINGYRPRIGEILGG